MTDPTISARLDAAALALCRMRCHDASRRISETDKRTYFEAARMEAIRAMQVHIACRDNGLLGETA